MAELAERGTTHFASLLSTLIVNGASTTCYDGQYFFDTDHLKAPAARSNKISVTVGGLPAATAGSTTALSPETMQQSHP